MHIGTRALASLAAWLAASAAPPALAQSASPPDKSQYWLLNPVPTNQMRDFSTDRPTKSNVPYTVDAGHFQYETDIVNFATLATGPITLNTLLVPNPTFKLGLTNNIDFEVNAPAGVGLHTFNAATNASSTIWGINDVLVRAKVNLWGNDGGKSALALIPYVKAPTAPLGIGNGATEEGLIVPFSLSLPDNFTLLFNSEVDAFKDIAGNGRHANFINLVNLSRPVVKDVTMYVEFWSDYNDDPTQRTTQLSVDVAFAWVVRPNLQVDVGADIGLTSTTPTIQVIAGISQRF